MSMGVEPTTGFEQWYTSYDVDPRNDCLDFKDVSPMGQHVDRLYRRAKSEMDLRVANYDVLEKLADGEVISPKPDLPNVSSGETSSMVLRVARNVVQNCPNVEVISKFDDDSPEGIFAKHILTTKVIGSDLYSNDMQQNLFASCKTSFTLGFACAVPALLQDGGGGWYMKYDTIHYRDVFPEPGCKDIRDATYVFVRRYLTQGEAQALVRNNTIGWDANALRRLLQNRPPSREQQSVDHQTRKHHQTPEGYEIVTLYTDDGQPFVTYNPATKMLLRIEKNKHPLKKHPVHFLVLEKDENQPLGKSQVERLIGRQDFQDLMLNGAMKLWYRNINPSIIGYGTVNAVPNLSPGKYTQISNPNAKVEAFEVNTQTLMQFSQISRDNLASMVSQVGAADQQMAMSGGGNGQGMSATPQGVEAQTAMVDITTNNYQKSVESFFSHYCSYALTTYFQELKAFKKVTPTADARIKLLEAGMPTEAFGEDGTLEMDFEKLAVEYFVRCVPGSLTELEDEKQLRTLNQMFIPLSQAMPALAAAQDPQALANASRAMSYIIGKQIELSGSQSAKEIGVLWRGGDVDQVNERDARIAALEEQLGGMTEGAESEMDLHTSALVALQQQVQQMAAIQQQLLEKLGVMNPGSDTGSNSSADDTHESEIPGPRDPSVLPASA